MVTSYLFFPFYGLKGYAEIRLRRICSSHFTGKQGVAKRYRLSWLTNSAFVYEPKCGGKGELRGLSQWIQLYTGAQLNLGDLTPYLTYGWKVYVDCIET
jgi:hypothetical protein